MPSFIRPVLLGCMYRRFLRVMPWRAKKRDRPLVPVRTPRSTNWSRNSHGKIVGLRRQVARISPAHASTRCELWSPPRWLGSHVSGLAQAPRSAAGTCGARPKPGRGLAAGYANRHADTHAATRSRRSKDKGDGIGNHLHPPTPYASPRCNPLGHDSKVVDQPWHVAQIERALKPKSCSRMLDHPCFERHQIVR